MAEGCGQGVGGVVGRGDLGQSQQVSHHSLDLIFAGTALAADGFFYLQGGVFGHFHARAGGGQNEDSARLGHDDGGLDVGGEEEFFDGDGVGPEFGDQGGDGVVDLVEPLRQGIGGGGVKGPPAHVARASFGVHNQTPADGGETGVESEDAHGTAFPGESGHGATHGGVSVVLLGVRIAAGGGECKGGTGRRSDFLRFFIFSGMRIGQLVTG